MNALQNNAHWLLRIALASVFLFHGFGKVATYFLIVGNAQPGKAA